MDPSKLREISALAKTTRDRVPTTHNPTPEETKALFSQLRAVAGVCMSGLDLREALKECVPAGRQGELYDAVRYIHSKSNTFSGSDGAAIKANLARISEILEQAAGPETSSDQPENKLPRMDVTYSEKLGSGAFGTVWRATDDLLARDIAVKFLTSTEQAMDEEALIREARSLAKLAHPNLVTVYAAAWLRHPETRLVVPAITMELLRGETLEKWWSHAHSRDEVLHVACGLVAGVLAMHAVGLVHGDLHEGNVMVLNDATTKLIDWRYHDTFLQRSSSHRRNEIAAEQRRALDRVDTLLEKQRLDTERVAIRGKTELTVVAEMLKDLRAGPHGSAVSSTPAPNRPSEGQQKLDSALRSVHSTAVVLVGGVTEFAGNIRRDAVNGEIQLGSRDDLAFQLRIPCGRGGIPILSVPYELLRSAWVDAAGRLNVLLEMPVVWNGRELFFDSRSGS